MINDTFGLDEDIQKNKVNDINIHELRDEINNQQLKNGRFFRGKNDHFRKLIETSMSVKGIDAIKFYLEYIDEHYDEGPVIIAKAEIFIEIDRELFNNSKRSDFGKRSNNIDKTIGERLGTNSYIRTGRVNCFCWCIPYLCFVDIVECCKIPTKKDYIEFIWEEQHQKKKWLYVKSKRSVRSLSSLWLLQRKKNNT